MSAEAEDIGDRLYGLARRLYPICRSITGKGVRDTLAIVRSTSTRDPRGAYRHARLRLGRA